MSAEDAIKDYGNLSMMTVIVTKSQVKEQHFNELLDMADQYGILYFDRKDKAFLYLITEDDYKNFHDFLSQIPFQYQISS